MEPDTEYDESKDCKPHLNGTLLTIFWPEHGLATVRQCPLNALSVRGKETVAMVQIACLSCRHLRGFFSPGRQISALPIDIAGHNRIVFQQVICEHPAVRRKGGGTGDSEDFSPRAAARELAEKKRREGS